MSTSLLHVFYLRSETVPEDAGLEAYDDIHAMVVQQNLAGQLTPFYQTYRLCCISFSFDAVSFGTIAACNHNFNDHEGIVLLATHFTTDRPVHYTLAFSYLPRGRRTPNTIPLTRVRYPCFAGVMGHVGYRTPRDCELVMFMAEDFALHREQIIRVWPHPVMLILEPFNQATGCPQS